MRNMKKIFVILVVLFIFCSCNDEQNLLSNSNDYSLGTFPEKNEPSMETIKQNDYSMHTMDAPMIIGHTSDSHFTNGLLFFSAQAFSKNSDDTMFDGSRYIYKIDLEQETMDIIPNVETSINTFVDDSNGNIYYVIQQFIEAEEKYLCKICGIDQFGNTVSSFDLYNDSVPINGITNDSRNNWYISTFEAIYNFDSDFSFLKKLELPNEDRIYDLICLQGGLGVVFLENNIFKIYKFNQEKEDFFLYATLPRETSQVFKGSAQYDFFYLVTDETYSQSLYGWNAYEEPELLLNYKDYFNEDIGTLNIYVDDKHNIFLLANGDFYSKSPTSKIIVFLKN